MSVQLRKDKRKQRLRTKLKQVSKRLRLSVFKSNKHIYAQIIDDNNSQTLVSASSLEKDLREDNKLTSNISFAQKIGKLIGERAIDKNIKEVVFDKGSHKYHGLVKALADEARKKIDF